MDLWHPPTDQPHLLVWWRPLVLAARAARLDRCPWPIYVDDLVLRGRVDRGTRPAIWVYKHPESRGELYLDRTGQAYKFTRTPNARSFGRFTPCEIRAAIWAARLPSVVEPVWYDEPRPGRSEWRADDDLDELDEHDDLDGQDEPGSERAPAPRTRGHLTLVGGGRPLAG